ncbi:DUF748 domain-containing protein [Bdellovibrio sp. NC01]|uniref:DUF748 domain-containing protein n=1 Tax=Bdellovibrio sp. NC01 TaxID=2220073 RepID=UPI00115B29BC|nr:DUF748 domain-containing protein [Bdellovibrio sp. NC01]QDK37103.1 hypothetical protein DOE51_05605 [Bdellovibrio sp. NC01]
MGLIRFSANTIRNLSLTFVGLVVLYTIAGFFVVPMIAKNEIQKHVAERLGAKPEIKKIKFHPFTFEAAIEGFSLPEPGGKGTRPRLQFDVFYVNLSIWHLLKKEIYLSEVRIKHADGQFTILKNGETNWEIKELPSDKKAEGKKDDKGSDWLLFIEHIKISNSKLNFQDETHNTPLSLPLGPVSLSASDISTHLDSETSINSLAIDVGEKGHVKVSGSMTPKPFSADLNLDMAEIPLEFLTAYLSDKTYLVLQQGSTDIKGKLRYQKGNIIFNGDSNIHDLVLNQAEVEQPVVTWKRLDLKKIEVQTSPMSVKVDEAILKELDTEIILRKDGTLNYRTVLRNPPPLPKAKSNTAPANKKAVVAKETAEKKPAFDFNVGKLTLIDSQLDYADEQIRPNFRAHVHGINGTIEPISPDPQQKINVAIAGAVEDYGKFQGKGYYIPGVKYPSLNLDMSFHNIEMTTFTPYAGVFAGYEIKKGKLFLDFNYVLVNHRIKGKNQVLLDQFELGNKIESDKAPHWPLKLALALMKDRKGQIKFKLPVEGDVNSPSFSWGNLVWTAIKNMFVNILAAPFDFLSSAFGGGEDLQTVFFEPGAASLTTNESAKILNLAKALNERPNLSLEIKGQYQNSDIATLQEEEYDARLQAELKKANGNRDHAVVNLAKQTMKSEELNKYIADYKTAHAGSDKDIAVELEKKVQPLIQVSDDKLKDLAMERGRAVMTALIAQKIPAERLFLLAGSKSDDEKEPHTLLTLKEQ